MLYYIYKIGSQMARPLKKKDDEKPMRFTIDIDRDIHTVFKVIAAAKNMTMKDMVIEEIKKIIERAKGK
jgi:hypothetical protein